MIAKLTGLVDSAGEDSAVIDVAGVGYLVFASGRTLRWLAAQTGRVSLAVETHVREDHIHLYGFADDLERDWFCLLTTVQGVGARVALAILTALTPDQLADAVLAQDKVQIARAQGVGPKLAQRVTSELKDRVERMAVVRHVAFAAAGAVVETGTLPDAVSALVNLGYRRGDAFGAVSAAARKLGDQATVEALVRAGLKELGT
jgi:Holliday junction DNA helicase RuvA